MSDVDIEDQINRIKTELEEDNSIEMFKVVLTEIKEIEKIVSKALFADNRESGSFVITELFTSAESPDCCEGCGKIPKLYTAFTGENYLDQISDSDFNEIEQNIKSYLEIASEYQS